MTPDELIKTFDDCLEYVYGRRMGRDNPYKDDMKTAQGWIDDGLPLFLAAIVFYEQMSRLHERFLRNNQDRQYVPHSLKVFDDNIRTANHRQARGGNYDTWENEELRWRSRVKGWMKQPNLWQADHWGPTPGQSGCRMPRAVMKEMEDVGR
jgi:hypothetical protein